MEQLNKAAAAAAAALSARESNPHLENVSLRDRFLTHGAQHVVLTVFFGSTLAQGAFGGGPKALFADAVGSFGCQRGSHSNVLVCGYLCDGVTTL